MRYLSRLLVVRRAEERASMKRMDAEEQYGQDSPQERKALERATDYAVEADMLYDLLEQES